MRAATIHLLDRAIILLQVETD